MDIAYQVIGDGPHNLLMLPAAMVSIDSIDAEPSMHRFHRHLAAFCRVIRFDYRGTGLSSRIASIDEFGLSFCAEDAIAVMDDLGCQQATVFAAGFAAPPGLVLAADYPDRVHTMVIVNGAARMLRAPDYPFGAAVSQGDLLTTVALDLNAVDRGFDVLELAAPTVAHNAAFRSWWDLAGNRAASPTMARAVGKVAVEADVREALTRITAPTLILHRDRCVLVPPEHGRYLAEHITQSRYTELPGTDALYWVGETSSMLHEIEEFITGVRVSIESGRAVATTMFTDIVGSTEHAATLGDLGWRDLLDSHDNVVRHQLKRFGGREISTAGDGFLALFTSPSTAIECAQAIVDAVHPLGVEVRVGIHAGEVEIRGSDVAGMTVHIGARVAALAAPNEVLVTSTVREMMTGSRRTFHERGEYTLKGVPGQWRLFAV
jgi:class 3 adenylate cyclase